MDRRHEVANKWRGQGACLRLVLNLEVSTWDKVNLGGQPSNSGQINLWEGGVPLSWVAAEWLGVQLLWPGPGPTGHSLKPFVNLGSAKIELGGGAHGSMGGEEEDGSS